MNEIQRQIVTVCKGLPRRSFKRQRSILYQGEVPRSVYVIKSGVVRVYNIAENGEERIIELLTAGDILPVAWVFGSSNVSLYYYDAFSDVEAYVCSKAEYMDILKQYKLEANYISLLVKRYTATTMHINALLQTHAQNKIAQGLQYLVLSHGKKMLSGKYKIDIRLTQQDLANLVGVTRETAAVELNRLRDKKVISYKSFTYTINYEALIRLGGGDEFSDVDII